MNYTDVPESLLIEFRQEVIGQFIVKGIKPPAQGSEAEMALFKKWVEGRVVLEEAGEDSNG